MPQSSHPSPALSLTAVTAGYDRSRPPVIRHTSMRLSVGSVVHLTGPNGAGKSTLVELASGYLPPWEGEVLVSGVEAASPEARAVRRICRTRPALYPQMTVREHLSFAATARGAGVADLLLRAEAYGLASWLDHPTAELSTGTLRKLWLLVCTVGRAPLVVLDEPFNGLDTDVTPVLADEIAAWGQDSCVVLVAHALPDPVVVSDVVSLAGAPAGRSL